MRILRVTFGKIILALLFSSLLFTAFPFAASYVHAESSIASRPATSGGGCTTSGPVKSCISENGSHTVLPDGYASLSGCIKEFIQLYIGGVPSGSSQYTPCISHFTAPSVHATAGTQYFTKIAVYYNNATYNVNSPTLIG